MASFVTDLWESIFTPGPTPTLLIATNVTFAALQIVLAGLLFATYSIHFVILSVLSGGLWWSINWFAQELRVHQQQEEEKARRAQAAPSPPSALESSESETEVEGHMGKKTTGGGRKSLKTPRTASPKPESVAEAVSNEVEAVERQGELKHRAHEDEAVSQSSTKSGVSTEDEWEKVSENENEKDK